MNDTHGQTYEDVEELYYHYIDNNDTKKAIGKQHEHNIHVSDHASQKSQSDTNNDTPDSMLEENELNTYIHEYGVFNSEHDIFRTDSRDIYQHDEYIEHGIYEDVHKTAAFLHEIQNGIDTCPRHHGLIKTDPQMSMTEQYRHIYETENEVYTQYIRNRQTQDETTADEQGSLSDFNDRNMVKNLADVNTHIMVDEPEKDEIIQRKPCFNAIFCGQDKAAFAISTEISAKQDQHVFEHIEADIDVDKQFVQNDYETFYYNERGQADKSTDLMQYTVEAVCLGQAKLNTKVTIDTNSDSYVISAGKGQIAGDYKNLRIPIIIDDGASVNIMPKKAYDKYDVLHELPKCDDPDTLPTIRTGNGVIKSHFWIQLPINIQGLLFQLQLLVCDSQADTAILLSRESLEQMRITHNYDENKLYIPRHCVKAKATKYVQIQPGKVARIPFKLNKHTYKGKQLIMQGKGIIWAKTQHASLPYNPIVVEVHNNVAVMQVVNNTDKVKNFQEGDCVGFFDLRSKDGGMQKTARMYPITTHSEYALMMHDINTHAQFASTLEPTKLAGPADENQEQNTFIVHEKPPIHVQRESLKTPGKDPYPWLDKTDPRRTMTDLEILKQKVKLDQAQLTTPEKEDFLQILLKYREAFSLRDEIGTCPFFEVSLKLKDEAPFFVRPYPIKEDMKKVVQKEMDRLEKLGIIKKGLTGYSSPVLLVKRKNNALPRVVTDFRVLNEKLVKVNHAFPLVRDCLDAIGASDCDMFSVFDLRDAYHTLRLSLGSQKFCGITPYYGANTYQYLRMGMGMSCSPGIWGQFVNKIREELPNKERYKIIMDDILIFSKKETHLQDIIDLFKVLIKYGLKISPHKCQLFRTQLVYMGLEFLIENGKPSYKPMKDKCDAIRNMQSLTGIKECRQFCGMVNFLSTFLPELRKLLIPIYALTKKNATFKWSEECEINFCKIKELVTQPPVLRMPASQGIFRLESDTSREACGGALYQWQNEEWRLIGYHSKRLPDAVRNYGVCELELTGLVCNIHGFEHLLKNNYFEVIIDHKAIEYLKRAKHEPTTRRLGSLLLKLQDYTFDIKYLQGSKLKLSDALSRLYIEEKHNINDVIPLNFLIHTTAQGQDSQLIMLSDVWYAHKTRSTTKKLTQVTPNANKMSKKQQVSAGAKTQNVSQARKNPKITKQVVSTSLEQIRTETNDQLIQLQNIQKDLDNENNQIVQTIREPDLQITQTPKPIIADNEEVVIYRKHIPKQELIDKELQLLRTKVLRNMHLNIQSQDLIREYDESQRFKDVYAYIKRNKLPSLIAIQRKIANEASNYVIANDFLIRLEKIKEGNEWKYQSLLVIPENMENALFHMYHNSALAMHQGPWKVFHTMKKRFYIPNMLQKLVNYIDACHVCLKTKPKPAGQQPVIYGYIPKDYIPLESLACDIKYMPKALGVFQFLLMVTCEQTNFVFAIPLKEHSATHIAEALLSRVFSIAGPPKYLSVDKAQELTGQVISILLKAMRCKMQIISPWNHGSSKAERQIKTIGEMITKMISDKGEMWPLFAATAAYAMNTYTSEALRGFSPYDLVFGRPPRILPNYEFEPLESYPVEIRTYVSLLRDRGQMLRQGQMNWKIKQARDKNMYNEMFNNVTRFKVGDMVYALAPYQSALHTGMRKFRQDFVGPLFIASVYDDTHYQLKRIIDNEDEIIPGIFHVNRLKKGAEMTTQGIIQSEKALKQYLEYVKDSDPVANMLHQSVFDACSIPRIEGFIVPVERAR